MPGAGVSCDPGMLFEKGQTIMISSTGNAKVRELVKLKKNAKERSKRGVFLVEGPKMFREIPGELLMEVYASESFLRTEEGAGALDRTRGYGRIPETVSDSVFAYLSDTRSPQGILAVVRQLAYQTEDLMGQNPLILVLENLQDPGNLGTIVRTAEAAGATGLLLGRGCVDIYSPKVTRSTMGSIFRVPFVYTDHLRKTVISLKKQGVCVLAAHLKGSEDLYQVPCGGPLAFLIGNESRGLTDETAALADRAVRIPMSGSVESLNAAVASAILMFEAKRQRS